MQENIWNDSKQWLKLKHFFDKKWNIFFLKINYILFPYLTAVLHWKPWISLVCRWIIGNISSITTAVQMETDFEFVPVEEQGMLDTWHNLSVLFIYLYVDSHIKRIKKGSAVKEHAAHLKWNTNKRFFGRPRLQFLQQRIGNTHTQWFLSSLPLVTVCSVRILFNNSSFPVNNLFLCLTLHITHKCTQLFTGIKLNIQIKSIQQHISFTPFHSQEYYT